MRLAAVIAVILLALVPSDGIAAPQSGDPAVALLISAETAMLDLTNADRIANGLAPLILDTETLPIARQRATTQLGLSELSHYDSHGELAFARLLDEAHVRHELIGENLASAAFYTPAVPLVVERALMASRTHRANVLEPRFTRVAIATVVGDDGRVEIAEIYR